MRRGYTNFFCQQLIKSLWKTQCQENKNINKCILKQKCLVTWKSILVLTMFKQMPSASQALFSNPFLL